MRKSPDEKKKKKTNSSKINAKRPEQLRHQIFTGNSNNAGKADVGVSHYQHQQPFLTPAKVSIPASTEEAGIANFACVNRGRQHSHLRPASFADAGASSSTSVNKGRRHRYLRRRQQRTVAQLPSLTFAETQSLRLASPVFTQNDRQYKADTI